MAKKTQKNSKTKSPTIHYWITSETAGFLILALSVMLILSLISFAVDPLAKNVLGMLGYTVGWAFHAVFGLGSYLLGIYGMWRGWRLLINKPIEHPHLKTFYVAVAVISTCFLLSLIEDLYPSARNFLGNHLYPGLWMLKQRYHLGGAPFYYLYHDLPTYSLAHLLNSVGVALLFSSTLLASLVFLFKIDPTAILRTLATPFRFKIQPPAMQPIPSEPFESLAKKTAIRDPEPAPAEPDSDFLRFVKLRMSSQPQEEPQTSKGMLAIRPEQNPTVRPSVSRKGHDDGDEEPEAVAPPVEKESKKIVEEPPKRKKEPLPIPAMDTLDIQNGDFSNYTLPSLALLTNAKKIDQSSLKRDLKKQAEVLEETLLSFGIEAKVGQINCGPTITSFEVHPAIGVKVQRIKALDNDIALNMEAKSIRIIAPIPGKAAVGIEVPNPQPQEVGFKEMLAAYQEGSQRFHVPVLLGKAVNGDYVMSDLAKMPHCIIAGATGSGKSVCINTIIMSILLNAKPDQIKLLMVDPKKVELTPYTRLPHMLAPVITEPHGAAAALNWLVKEMEKRYEILKLVGVRNIDSFNKRTINKAIEDSLEREIPTSMPYIVGIIDELADLMMAASQDIETPIARIAQMARAVGIHLILATQRPSREVITGLIKANFPTRVSFKVASRVNSQIVLDEIGAESLLGNGDMLFLPPGTSNLIRAQGAYIRDEDILAVVQHICSQAPPNYLIQSFDRIGGATADAGIEDEEIEFDSLYEQAKAVILGTGNASTTFLQRKLKVGYARAASLMDQLESQGIVGPAEGSKPRQIIAMKKSEPVEPAELALVDAYADDEEEE